MKWQATEEKAETGLPGRKMKKPNVKNERRQKKAQFCRTFVSYLKFFNFSLNCFKISLKAELGVNLTFKKWQNRFFLANGFKKAFYETVYKNDIFL